MRSRTPWIGLLGVACLALSLPGCGGSDSSPPAEQLLLAYTLRDDGGTQLPGITSYTAALGVETSPGSGSYPEVFEDYVLTPADEGTTLLTLEVDDIEFPQLVDLMTNGADDALRIRLQRDTVGGVVAQFLESTYPYDVPRSGPDLQGYVITRFELHVLDLRFVVPGSDPNRDGNWQDRFVGVRFEVYGMR